MRFQQNTAVASSVVTLFFLLTLFYSVSSAGAKTSSKNSAATTPIPQKKWAVIDGFRSAKFGMDKNRVKKAIGKDFKISSRKIKQSSNSIEKTEILEVTVPELFPAGGASRVGYVFGHQSKKLMQINIIWGLGATKKVNGQSVVDAANLLRTHFVKKKYSDNMLLNARLDETKIIVFRGADKKGRMAVLVLDTPKALEGESLEDAAKKVSLQLSYILKPNSPDILTIEEGMF
jgi:hypothetical protein